MVKNGVVQVQSRVPLPEGTVVTVTVGEGELARAGLLQALLRLLRPGGRTRPVPPLASGRMGEP